jgi:hypothetical protein
LINFSTSGYLDSIIQRRGNLQTTNEGSFGGQVTRYQNKMLFVYRKKFRFKKNFPSDQVKDFGIDHKNEDLIPLIQAGKNCPIWNFL